MSPESTYHRNKNFYSDDELIALLQKLADQLGRAPTLEDIRIARQSDDHNDMVVPQVFQRRFRGFHRALEASGIETEHILHSRRYEERDMLDSLTSSLLNLDRRPTHPDIDRIAKGGTIPSRMTLASRFGSVNRSLELAGILKHHALKALERFAGRTDSLDDNSPYLRNQALYASWLNSPDVDLPFSFSRFAYEDGHQDVVRMSNASNEILIDMMPSRIYIARHEFVDKRTVRKSYSVRMPLTDDTSRYHVVVDRNQPIVAEYLDQYQNPHTIYPPRSKQDSNNLMVVNTLLCDAASLILQIKGPSQTPYR